MPTIQQVVNDPDFQGLPDIEKKKVLLKIDKDFQGLPNTEQDKVVISLSQFQPDHPLSTEYPMEKSPVPEGWQEEFKQKFAPRTMPSIIQETGKLGLEGGLMVGGAKAGAAIHPLLAPVGAGVGYVAGKAFERGIGINKSSPSATEELKQQAKEVKTGMEAYLLGETAIPAGKIILSPLKRPYQFVKDKLSSVFVSGRKAGDMLIANTSEGPIYAKNIEEANKIQEEIPDLIFTRGQQTFGPKELKQERALFLTPKGGQMNQETIVNNNNAIRKYYQKHFPEKESIEDVLQKVSAAKGGIETAKKQASGGLEAETRKLMAKPDIQESGKTILGRAQELEKGAIAKSRGLYEEIGDMSIPAKKIADDIDEIIKPQGKYEKIAETVPDILHTVRKDLDTPLDKWSIANYEKPFNELSERMQAGLKQNNPEVQALLNKPPEMSLNDLRGLRSEILEQIRGLEKGTLTPNTNRLTSRLSKFLKSIDDTLDEAGKTGEGGNVKKLREANKVFREERIIPFEQGTVGTVLQKGARGEISRIDDSLIAGKFFKNPDTADDFIKAMGSDKQAKQAIEDYASQDLLNKATNPVTGEIEQGRLLRWFYKNNKVLDKFGLKDKFKDISSASKIVETAKLAETEFDKSAASKLLGTDIEQAISAAFAGHGKSTGMVAQELLNNVKNDASATKGLKKAFSDFLFNKVKTTATDIATNPTLSVAQMKRVFAQYASAMRVLYKDEPQKIHAMMNIQKTYDILNRTSYSLLKGSDTAEKTIDTIGRMAGIAITNRLSRLNAIETLTKMYSKHSKETVDEYLLRAAFNPEYAQTLTNFAKGIKPAEMAKKMDLHIRSFAAIKGYADAEKEEEPQQPTEPLDSFLEEKPDYSQKEVNAYADINGHWTKIPMKYQEAIDDNQAMIALTKKPFDEIIKELPTQLKKDIKENVESFKKQGKSNRQAQELALQDLKERFEDERKEIEEQVE